LIICFSGGGVFTADDSTYDTILIFDDNVGGREEGRAGLDGMGGRGGGGSGWHTTAGLTIVALHTCVRLARELKGNELVGVACLVGMYQFHFQRSFLEQIPRTYLTVVLL